MDQTKGNTLPVEIPSDLSPRISGPKMKRTVHNQFILRINLVLYLA